MFIIYINFSLLLLISTEFHTVINQNDYDYTYGNDYRPSGQLQWPDQRDEFVITYFKDQNKISERARVGIVDSVLGLIAGGKCLIKCVLRFVKNCYGIIGCIWDCFLPDKPLDSRVDVNKDKDIRLEWAEGDHSEDMTPRDIIAIAECFIQCLVRHLPRNVLTLIDWLNCTITRCLCIGAKK